MGKVSFVLAIAVGLAACTCNEPTRTVVVSQPAEAPVATAQNHIMDAKAFNLGTVVALVKGNKVTDAKSLESVINDPSTGINNVDLDGDGNIDFVAVQEIQQANGKRFELVAYPSSRNGEGAVTIASIDLVLQGPQVVIQAGYPNYVYGYNSYYYHDYTMARDILFWSWVMSARPLYLARPYYSYGWGARPVAPYGTMMRTRTTYESRTRVSPVRAVAPPSHYSNVPRATRVPSQYARPAAPSGSNLGDRRGSIRSFQPTSPTAPRSKATGFMPSRPSAPASPGYRPSSPSYRPSTPSYRPSTPSYRPSTPSYRPSTPSYRPSTPSYRPSAPSYRPSTPSYRPSTPSFRPSGGGFGRPSGGFGGSGGGRRR